MPHGRPPFARRIDGSTRDAKRERRNLTDLAGDWTAGRGAEATRVAPAPREESHAPICNRSESAGSFERRTGTMKTAGEVLQPPRRDVGLYSAFTGIIVPFEAGVFGSVTTSTPFLNVAVTLLASTAIGSLTLRKNAP